MANKMCKDWLMHKAQPKMMPKMSPELQKRARNEYPNGEGLGTTPKILYGPTQSSGSIMMPKMSPELQEKARKGEGLGTTPKMSIMLNKNAVNTSTDPRYTAPRVNAINASTDPRYTTPRVNAINTSTDSRYSAPKVSRSDSPRNNGVSDWQSHANQAGSFDKKAYDRQYYRDHKADYQEGGKYWHKYGEWKDKVKAAVKGAVNKLSKLGESVYDKTHSDQLARLRAGTDRIREHNKRMGGSGVIFEDLRYKNSRGIGPYTTTETAKLSRHNDKVSADAMRRHKKVSPWKVKV